MIIWRSKVHKKTSTEHNKKHFDSDNLFRLVWEFKAANSNSDANVNLVAYHNLLKNRFKWDPLMFVMSMVAAGLKDTKVHTIEQIERLIDEKLESIPEPNLTEREKANKILELIDLYQDLHIADDEIEEINPKEFRAWSESFDFENNN